MHCVVAPPEPVPIGTRHPIPSGVSLFGQRPLAVEPLPRGAQVKTFGGSPAIEPDVHSTADVYETRPGFWMWMKASEGIGNTTPSLPSLLQTSSAARFAVPAPTQGVRSGSLSCWLVGNTTDWVPRATEPYVPLGGTWCAWVESAEAETGTPPGPT